MFTKTLPSRYAELFVEFPDYDNMKWGAPSRTIEGFYECGNLKKTVQRNSWMLRDQRFKKTVIVDGKDTFIYYDDESVDPNRFDRQIFLNGTFVKHEQGSLTRNKVRTEVWYSPDGKPRAARTTLGDVPSNGLLKASALEEFIQPAFSVWKDGFLVYVEHWQQGVFIEGHLYERDPPECDLKIKPPKIEEHFYASYLECLSHLESFQDESAKSKSKKLAGLIPASEARKQTGKTLNSVFATINMLISSSIDRGSFTAHWHCEDIKTLEVVGSILKEAGYGVTVRDGDVIISWV